MEISPQRSANYLIRAILCLFIGILAFLLIININFASQLFYLVFNQNIAAIIFLIVFFFVALRIDESHPFAGIIIILIIFALPLAYYWMAGITHQGLIGGIIPHRDGMYYYLNARNVINGGLFDQYLPGRPLFPSFLVTLILLTNNNIQIVIIILAILAAVSSYLLVKELQMEIGIFPSAVFMMGIFMFYKNYIPSLLTEQLGLILSMIGLAIILMGMRQPKKRFILFGIFIISLSQNTRPSALLILAALIIWAGSIFGKNRLSFRDLFYAFLAVLAGFLINYLVFSILSNQNSNLFSSFSYMFYAMSKGGANWTQIYKDYPNVLDSREIFLLALDNIKRYPLGIVIGVVKAFRDFIGFGRDGTFSYIIGFGNNFNVVVLWIIYLFFTISGLVYCIKNRAKSFNLLALISFLGIILSIPFAPPNNSSSMRTYAASNPFFLILPSIGMYWLLGRKLSNSFLNEKSKYAFWSQSSALFSIVLTIVVCLAPFIYKPFLKAYQGNLPGCSADQIPVNFYLDYGSYIKIIPDGKDQCGKVPDLCKSNFIANGVHPQELYEAIIEKIKSSNSTFIFSEINDLNSGMYYYILIEDHFFVNGNPPISVISACLSMLNKQENLFNVEYVKP